jgi:hypothetical protein
MPLTFAQPGPASTPIQGPILTLMRCGLLAGTALSLLMLSACGGHATAPDAPLGGTVAGLSAGASLVLEDANGGSLTVTANGNFQLPNLVPPNYTYNVVVQQQPVAQTCTVTSGSGQIDASGDEVDSVVVSCAYSAVLSGNVEGLASGTSLSLSDGVATQTVSANGGFAFTDGIAPGATYTLSVSSQPSGQTCVVIHGSGTIDATGDDVTNIVVNCAPPGSLGGTIAGLPSGASVTLSDGISSLVVAANGSFVFGDSFAAGAAYGVSVVTQPAGAACGINGASGSFDGADDGVSSVSVVCGAPGTLGGTVSGLAAGHSVTLNYGLGTLTLAADGAYTLPDQFGAGYLYHVSVATQPLGQTCTVNNASGSLDANDDPMLQIDVVCQ